MLQATNQYQIKITSITPVCIGDGQKLSPFSDYKLKDGKLIYLNQETIQQVLKTRPNLIEDFVKGIISEMDNTGSKFDIESFFYNRAKIDLAYITLKTIDSTAVPKGNKNLYTIIKNAGIHPYIPGSSLKGAIKTALLYNWLMDKNNHWCKDYLKLYDKNSTGNLPKKDENNMQDGKKVLEEELNNKFNSFEFAVSDSDLFPEDSIKAIDTKRLHLKEGNFTIPQTWEAIKENSNATISISSIKICKDELLNWMQICKVINLFSHNSNDIEWEIFDNCCQKNEKLNDDLYDSLFTFYETMEENINNADSKTCYLKLGSGKGYYFNSIGLALYNADETEDKKLFVNFLRNNGFGKIFNRKNKQWEKFDLQSDEFPLTRVLDFKTFNPLGWVKLELLKEKEL
jgi:CRISPR-associated protein Csm5